MSLHRDDLPPEFITKMEAMYPGQKMVCLGDLPTNDETARMLREMTADMAKRADWSQHCGRCFSCGDRFPGHYPPSREAFGDAGWGQFGAEGWSDEHESLFILCPGCQAE